MPIATVACRAQLGLHAPLVQVEVSLDVGLPVFSNVQAVLCDRLQGMSDWTGLDSLAGLAGSHEWNVSDA